MSREEAIQKLAAALSNHTFPDMSETMRLFYLDRADELLRVIGWDENHGIHNLVIGFHMLCMLSC